MSDPQKDRFGNPIIIGATVTTAVRVGDRAGVSDGIVVGFGERKTWRGGTVLTVKVRPFGDGPIRTIGEWEERMTVVTLPNPVVVS